MDQDARFIGLGLAFDSLVTAIGQFRSLAQKQVQQLAEKDVQIRDLQQKLASLSAPPAPSAPSS